MLLCVPFAAQEVGCLADFVTQLVHLVLKSGVVLSCITVPAMQDVHLLQRIHHPAVHLATVHGTLCCIQHSVKAEAAQIRGCTDATRQGMHIEQQLHVERLFPHYKSTVMEGVSCLWPTVHGVLVVD